MLNTKYLIRNATNMLWYTEDHAVPMADRWSPNISDAAQYATPDDAKVEIELDDHGLTFFNIFEIQIKS